MLATAQTKAASTAADGTLAAGRRGGSVLSGGPGTGWSG